MRTSTVLLALGSLAVSTSARNIVFTTSDAPIPSSASSCTSFHGTYSGTSVYLIEDTCTVQPEEWMDDAAIAPAEAAPIGDYAVLHVQPAALLHQQFASRESWLNTVFPHMDGVYARIPKKPAHKEKQHILTTTSEHGNLLSTSLKPNMLHCPNQQISCFFAVAAPLLPIVDQLFPPTSVLVSVPLDHPLVHPASVSAPSWLNNTLKQLHYSPLVDAIIQDIEPEQLERDVKHLTAEDGKASWRTRHSFTTGGREAAKWIKETVEREGGASCVYHEHDYGFNPNVICTYKGRQHPDELVVMGAHYDSRGTFGHVRAPGGDDDASGTSALLSLSRLFKAYNIRFSRTVVLAFFSGEEQGLWGSRGYAKQLKEEGVDVRFMLQADMLGYHLPGEPMQLALPDKYDTIEARWLVGNLSTLYVPELQVGTTPACCSDHQSFDQQGYVSTWVFERNGPIADPKYHNSEDLSDRDGYDFDQIAAIARVMFATVLVVADFVL